MTTSTIIEDRSWAIGLNQEDFGREWISRLKGDDVIPDVEEWVKGQEPNYGGINGVNPEDMISQSVQEANQVAVNKELTEQADKERTALPLPEATQKKKHSPQKGDFPCRGCGRVFEYKISRAGHERHCKVALNTRM